MRVIIQTYRRIWQVNNTYTRISKLFFCQSRQTKLTASLANLHITSNDCDLAEEKVSWWDFPPCLELEDLAEDPEGRIGTGEGAIWSHGEAVEPVHFQKMKL